MRLHISLDEHLVAKLDARVGRRGRSAFISQLICTALEDECRWDMIEQALGSLADEGHAWDAEPGGWVRAGRQRAEP